MREKTSAGAIELQIKREKREARLYGMKIIIQQNIRKTKRLLVWYAGEVVTFEYRGFIIDLGVFSDVSGIVIKNGAIVQTFDTCSGEPFKNLLGKYLHGDAAINTALSEHNARPKTKSRTTVLVDELPQVEVAIYNIQKDVYVTNYFLGPASRISVLDAVKLSASFRKVIDDYVDGGLNKVPAVVIKDIHKGS